MLTRENYERYIHYKNHISNPNINYIRLFNCKYCKQDRRDYYGSRFRTPNNSNRNINMNLLNYSRVQNIIGQETINPFRSQIPRYIPTRSNPMRNNRNPIIRNRNPIIRNSNHIIRNRNPIIRNSNHIIRNSNHIIRNSNTNLPTHTNFIQRNIQSVGRNVRRSNSYISVLRNNYIYGNNLTRRNTINLTYFRDSIRPLSDDEIEDFEELTDMEVKTTLEEVNKGCSIEIYNEEKKDYCSICCEDIVKSQIIRKMKCEHNFHYKCLDEWLETNKKCPLCRFSI